MIGHEQAAGNPAEPGADQSVVIDGAARNPGQTGRCCHHGQAAQAGQAGKGRRRDVVRRAVAGTARTQMTPEASATLKVPRARLRAA